MLREVIINQQPMAERTSEVIAESRIVANSKLQITRECIQRGNRVKERWYFTRLAFDIGTNSWTNKGSFFVSREQLTDVVDALDEVLGDDETGASDATL